jgi:L-ribulose-5-phosphate 3-epimerase
MRIGCSTYSYRQLFADGRMNVYAFLDKSYELGLDGVELLEGMFPTEKEDLIKIKRRARELGLQIAACTIGCPATTADKEQRAKGMEDSKKWVEIANFLGAPALRVDTGGIAQGMEIDQAFENAFSFFKELAEYSGEFGISLGMENHSAISNTGEKVVRVVQGVGSKWFGLTPDFGNFIGRGEEEGYRSIEMAAPHAVFVHAKLYDIGYKKDCGCCPPCLDEKTLDFERIIDIFIKVGYSGYMSIEYEGREDPVTAVPKCVKVLQQYI